MLFLSSRLIARLSRTDITNQWRIKTLSNLNFNIKPANNRYNNNQRKIIMLRKHTLIVGLPICLTLLACGGSSDESISLPIETTYSVPNLTLDASYEVLEGNILEIIPSINVDQSLTYRLNWSVNSSDAFEVTSDNEKAVVNTNAVNEDVAQSVTVTLTDSQGQTDSTTFTVTVKNEIIDSIEGAFKNLERTNQLPLPDQSDTLSGFDLNQDGVRDDIERLIDMQPVTDKQKGLLTENAKWLQEVMALDLTDEQAISFQSEKSALNSLCLALSFDRAADALKYSNLITSQTMSTFQRLSKYEEYNAKLDGSVTRMPLMSACL
jgi:hypothetical protein